MAILEIVKYPDPRLRERAEPVEEITDEIRGLLADMAETMYAAPGLGLAAQQVGSHKRVIVVDVGDDEETGMVAKLYKLVNPEITEAEGTVDSEEGCLSIPSIREKISRAERVVVKALDQDGNECTIEADGILAICLQHEIDHLNGVLFIDHLSKLKLQLLKAKMRKRGQS